MKKISKFGPSSDDAINELANAMRRHLAGETKVSFGSLEDRVNHPFTLTHPHHQDRRWRDLRVYKSCFLGSSAVKYLTDRFGSLEEGLRRGNELIERGYCGHVCNEHLFEANNKTLFYRWFPEPFSRLSESTKLKRQIKELQLTVAHLSQGLEHTREQVFENEARLVMLEDGLRGISNPLFVIALLFGLSLFQEDFFALVTHRFPAFSATLSLHPYASICLILHVSIYSYSLKNSVGYGITTRELFRDGMVQSRAHEASHDDNSNNPAGVSVQVAPQSSSTAEQRRKSEIPRLETWAHRPVMVCTNTGGGSTAFEDREVPIGKPFHFESSLFKGICLVRLKNIPSPTVTNQKNTSDYFKSRRRTFQVVTQGRFKEQMNVGDVVRQHIQYAFIVTLQHLLTRSSLDRSRGTNSRDHSRTFLRLG
jgi:hypothetical protein